MMSDEQDRDLVETVRRYYRRRAPEYEAGFRSDPAIEREIDAVAAAMAAALRGRRVLEVACGTGIWTARAARVARRVVAVDAAEEMLALARAKGLHPDKVEFVRGDAYALAAVPGSFDAALAVFWLSHVPRARLAGFLDGLHRRLEPGAAVFLADSLYAPGTDQELVGAPTGGDTFELRRLADGSRWRVLKNRYTAEQLRDLFAPLADRLEVHVGGRFWWVRYDAMVAKPATKHRGLTTDPRTDCV